MTTVLLGLAAVNTGNPLLYLLVATLVGFLAISALLGRWNLASLRLRVEWPDEIYDGVEAVATIVLENRRRVLPSFLLRVEFGEARPLFVLLETGERACVYVPVTFTGRGRRVLPPPQINSPFPAHFFLCRVTAAPLPPLLIFPAPLPGDATPAAHDFSESGCSFPPRSRDGEMDGVGNFRGEPPRLINWKLSARHNRLLVRESTGTGGAPVLLDPDHLPGGLEERLRIASFLVNLLLREKRPVGLRLGPRTISPGLSRAHKLRLLTELALYAPG